MAKKEVKQEPKQHTLTLVGKEAFCSCGNWSSSVFRDLPEDIIAEKLTDSHKRHLEVIPSQEKAAFEKAERLKNALHK